MATDEARRLRMATDEDIILDFEFAPYLTSTED